MKDKSRRRIADRADDIRLAIANIRSDVGGMRNILAHEYFRVDAAVVWDTINNDLSSLEHALRTIGDVGG
jgi:uncharacterized protein with HEPN domain